MQWQVPHGCQVVMHNSAITYGPASPAIARSSWFLLVRLLAVVLAVRSTSCSSQLFRVDPGARMRDRVPKQKQPEIVPKIIPISFSFHKYHQHTAR